MHIAGPNRAISSWLLIACGAWLVGLGFYFSVLRPPLLPEDLRFMDANLAQIRVAAPGLERWLQRVFTVMGTFMASAGLLTAFVANAVMPLRLKGVTGVIALSGLLSVVAMSAANFALQSDYKWLLLVPALIWLAALALFAARR